MGYIILNTLCNCTARNPLFTQQKKDSLGMDIHGDSCHTTWTNGGLCLFSPFVAPILNYYFYLCLYETENS